MKQINYFRIIIISLITGLIMLSSIFLEDIALNYDEINDIVLFIPREVANIFYKGWFEPSKLVFIAVFTFIFYTVLSFIIGYLIEKIWKK